MDTQKKTSKEKVLRSEQKNTLPKHTNHQKSQDEVNKKTHFLSIRITTFDPKMGHVVCIEKSQDVKKSGANHVELQWDYSVITRPKKV